MTLEFLWRTIWFSVAAVCLSELIGIDGFSSDWWLFFISAIGIFQAFVPEKKSES